LYRQYGSFSLNNPSCAHGKTRIFSSTELASLGDNESAFSNVASTNNRSKTGPSKKISKRSRIKRLLAKACGRTGVRNNPVRTRIFSSTQLAAFGDDDSAYSNVDSTDSWSKACSSEKVGVRSRVKRVLAKARGRTGIENNSETSSKSLGNTKIRTRTSSSKMFSKDSAPASIVANAASIGGLGAVVVDEQGTVDVALEFLPIKEEEKTGKIEREVNGINRSSSKKVTENRSSNTTEILTKDKSLLKNKSPASTYSKPIKPFPTPGPEDQIVSGRSFPATSDGEKLENSSGTVHSGQTFNEIDAFRGDVSAAFSLPPEPLPFTLPELNAEQKQLLFNGERLQFQEDMGREGSGFVAWDVKAPPDVVWDCLLDFYSYPKTIPTVRDIVMYTNTHLKDDYRHEQPQDYEDGKLAVLKHGTPSVTRAAFTLSKFRLKIAAIHKYRPHPQGDYMVFTLDPACTNLVLQSAKGVWHTQRNPDGKGEEYTRVWLLCEVQVSSLLPRWITDYAARKAMPRATTWLKPQVEAAASLWLKDP